MIAAPVSMGRTGWQTLIADLSIILFMVTAGALSNTAPSAMPKPSGVAPSTMARPLSVWREEAGGPSLADWLATQPHDPRQQLTIVVRYGPRGERALAARMAALLAVATRAGARARLVAEPGDGSVTAGFAFDAG